MFDKAYQDKTMLALVAISLVIVLASLAESAEYYLVHTDQHSHAGATVTVETRVPASCYRTEYTLARVAGASYYHETRDSAIALAHQHVDGPQVQAQTQRVSLIALICKLFTTAN